MQRATLEYWEENGWFVGRLKGIPGVFSQGRTLDELESNIREACVLMLDGSDDLITCGDRADKMDL